MESSPAPEPDPGPSDSSTKPERSFGGRSICAGIIATLILDLWLLLAFTWGAIDDDSSRSKIWVAAGVLLLPAWIATFLSIFWGLRGSRDEGRSEFWTFFWLSFLGGTALAPLAPRIFRWKTPVHHWQACLGLWLGVMSVPVHLFATLMLYVSAAP